MQKLRRRPAGLLLADRLILFIFLIAVFSVVDQPGRFRKLILCAFQLRTELCQLTVDPHIGQLPLPAVHADDPVIQVYLERTQRLGKGISGLRHGGKILPLLVGKAVYRSLPAEGIGIVPHKAHEAGDPLQLLGGKGQRGHGGLGRLGARVDLGADAAAHAAVGGVKALFQGLAHPIHRAHHLLKRELGAVPGGQPVVCKAAVADKGIGRRGQYGGADVGCQSDFCSFRHEKHLSQGYSSLGEVFYILKIMPVFLWQYADGAGSPPCPECGRSPPRRRG